MLDRLLREEIELLDRLIVYRYLYYSRPFILVRDREDRSISR